MMEVLGDFRGGKMKSRDALVEREKLDAGELSRRELAKFSPSFTFFFSFFFFSAFFSVLEKLSTRQRGTRDAGEIVESSVFFPAASSLTVVTTVPLRSFPLSPLFIVPGIYLLKLNIVMLR